MKYLILGLFYWSGLMLMAQSYHPLITPGKQSFVSLDCGPCPSIYEGFDTQLFFEGDSLLNGTVYHKLMMYTSHWYWGDTTMLAELLREDIIAHKIYRFAGSYMDSAFANPYYMNEEILWDYSLQIGDSVLTNFGDIWSKIVAIDTITLQNSHRVRVYKSNYNILFTEEIMMSSHMYWHYNTGMGVHYPNYSAINCAQGLNGVGLYPINCSSQYYVGVGENEVVQIEVYPNPAASQIVVNTPVEGEFQLYNLLGNFVLNTSILVSEPKHLSVAELPNGIYVWVFNSAKGVEKGKLVIER